MDVVPLAKVRLANPWYWNGPMRALYSGGSTSPGPTLLGARSGTAITGGCVPSTRKTSSEKPSEVNVRKSAAIKGIERVIWCPNYGTCESNLPRERLCVY